MAIWIPLKGESNWQFPISKDEAKPFKVHTQEKVAISDQTVVVAL